MRRDREHAQATRSRRAEQSGALATARKRGEGEDGREDSDALVSCPPSAVQRVQLTADVVVTLSRMVASPSPSRQIALKEPSPCTRVLASLALVAILFTPLGALARQSGQIVSDPALDAALRAFEQQLPQYVAAHPALTSGASAPVSLQGTKGKITYSVQMQGQYAVDYGSLRLASTTPISADRFLVTLEVDSVTLSGSADVTITRQGRTFQLDCDNTVFTVHNVTYAAEVQTASDGSVTVTNSSVSVPPKSVDVVLPCLRPGAEKVDDVPSQSVKNKTNSAITSAANAANSSVNQAARTAGSTAGNAISGAAGSPCGGTLQSDVDAIAADLAAISAQANSQGFSVAVQVLVADLQAILPALSAPEQAQVQKLVADLQSATSASGPGGATITAPEQATLTLDLYNVLVSTGASPQEAALITTDILAVMGTVTGISTVQLQADVRRFAADAQSCAGQ